MGSLLMEVHACNFSTQKVEAGEPPFPGQPGLSSEAISKKKERKSNRKCLKTPGQMGDVNCPFWLYLPVPRNRLKGKPL